MSGTVLAGVDEEVSDGNVVSFRVAGRHWLWYPAMDQWYYLSADNNWVFTMNERGSLDGVRSHLICFLSGLGVETSPIEEDPLEGPMDDPNQEELEELGGFDYETTPDLGMEVPIARAYTTPDEGIVGTGYHYNHAGKRVNWDVEFE